MSWVPPHASHFGQRQIQAVVRFHLVEAISVKAAKSHSLARQMPTQLSSAQALTAHLSTEHLSSSNVEDHGDRGVDLTFKPDSAEVSRASASSVTVRAILAR